MRKPILIVAAAFYAALVHATPRNELLEALKQKPNLERGRALYEEACAACHQTTGAGAQDGSIPNIAGQHYQVILKQLTDFRQTERLDLRMEAFARHRLKGPQDLADVAGFISKLPKQPTKDLGPGKFLAAGEQVYARACRHCHGAAAEGSDQLRHPRLAGQHYQYLLKQIDMMVDGSRFNAGWDHSQLLKSLTAGEIAGVADYLSRLGSPVPMRSNATR